MSTAQFQPPPTYALPIETDAATGKPTFNRVWLKWFYDLVQALNNAQVTGGTIQHNNLAGLQGGQANEYYHLTATEHNLLQTIETTYNAGFSGTITTAKLTAGGANGSMTFTNGILTAQVAAT